MDLHEPKPKKYRHLKQNLPLPIQIKKDGSIAKITAIFNGFSIIVSNEEKMRSLVSMGAFGKANFSRSFPQFMNYKPEILRNRQYRNRKSISQNIKAKLEKVIVVPDSDQEDQNEEYFKNLKPQYEIDNSGLQENVALGLEEAFFLVNSVECLEVLYKEKMLTVDELWQTFCKNQSNFCQNYVVYYYYRCKNWVVKPGIKFGGDFLLYKQGPAFYHASYVVVIQKDTEGSDSFNNMGILGLNRLCETAAKELLICKLHWPQNTDISFKNLSDVKIQEVLVQRWNSATERQVC